MDRQIDRQTRRVVGHSETKGTAKARGVRPCWRSEASEPSKRSQRSLTLSELFAFSLAEMMIVMFIMSLVAAITVPLITKKHKTSPAGTTIQIRGVGTPCSATDKTITISTDRSSLLTCQSGVWADKTQGQGIGYGQTWQNLTSSRCVNDSANCTYTNNTDKPIWVTVVSQAGASYVASCTLSVDGVMVAYSGTYVASYEFANCPGIVPPGSTYSGGTQGYVHWAELR